MHNIFKCFKESGEISVHKRQVGLSWISVTFDSSDGNASQLSHHLLISPHGHGITQTSVEHYDMEQHSEMPLTTKTMQKKKKHYVNLV